jgi:hypothetical protein
MAQNGWAVNSELIRLNPGKIIGEEGVGVKNKIFNKRDFLSYQIVF